MGNGAEDGRAENKDRWNGIVTAQSNFVTKILKETKKKKEGEGQMPIGLQFNPKCTRPPSSTVEVCEPLRSVTTLDGVYFSNRSGQFLSVRELLYV